MCVYACVHVCVCACMCACVSMCAHVCVCMYVYNYMCMHASVCVYHCTLVSMYMCVHVQHMHHSYILCVAYYILYDAKFWRDKILANLVNYKRFAKIFLSKISFLKVCFETEQRIVILRIDSKFYRRDSSYTCKIA